MATVYLAPIGNGVQFQSATGIPLNGGLLATYAAGTTTPQATFTTSTGTVTSANPIVFGSDGRPTTEIWLSGGVAYKFLLADSLSSSLATYDNLYGINDPAGPVSVDNTGAALGYVPITSVAGTANAITGAVPASFTAFAPRQCFRLIPTAQNTGPVNIVLTPSGASALTARNVFLNGQSLVGGEFRVGIPVWLEDDGTQLNIVGNGYMVAGVSSNSVTAAATINLDNMSGDYGQLFGTTQVTAVTLGAGRERTLTLANQLVIAGNVSTILPGGTNITGLTNDVVVFRGQTGGNVQLVTMTRNSQAQSVIAAQAANTVFAGPSSGVSATPGFRALVAADFGFTVTSSRLTANVALTTTGGYVDGPSVSAQASTGTWLCMGQVTLTDTAPGSGGPPNVPESQFIAKLWDGTTIVASGGAELNNTSAAVSIHLVGLITNPAGNIRVTVKDTSTATGSIQANLGGNTTQDSVITILRIA